MGAVTSAAWRGLAGLDIEPTCHHPESAWKSQVVYYGQVSTRWTNRAALITLLVLLGDEDWREAGLGFALAYLLVRTWRYLVWASAHPGGRVARKIWPHLRKRWKLQGERWYHWITPGPDSLAIRAPAEIDWSPTSQKQLTHYFTERVQLPDVVFNADATRIWAYPERLREVDASFAALRGHMEILSGSELCFGVRTGDGGLYTADLGAAKGTPHVLFLGPTGVAKSSSERFLLAQILKRQMGRTFTVDVKGTSQNWLMDVAGAHLARELEECQETIAAFEAEMRRRLFLLKGELFPDKMAATFDPWWLFIDEGHELTKQLKEDWATKRGKKDPRMPPAMSALESISGLSRSSGGR